MMDKGWIRLYRSIWDNPVVTKDPEYFETWIWLLTHAAHSEEDALFDGRRITIKPGQIYTNLTEISEALKFSRSKVDRILKLFESETQIEMQVKRQGRLIAIVNWHLYQESKTQAKRKRNASETQVKRNRNASEIPTSYKELRIKELRNIGGDSETPTRRFRPPTVEQVSAYCAERRNAIDPEEFVDYYESCGWMVGKKHMKDWKAAVRTWERNRSGKPQKEDTSIIDKWMKA